MSTAEVGYKRKDLRVPLEDDVRYTADKFNWYFGWGQNISKSGIFIETERIFKIGSLICMNLILAVPGHQTKKLKVVGKVVRVANGKPESSDRTSQGMGVEFCYSLGEELILRKFILDAIDHSITINFAPLPQASSCEDSEQRPSPYALCKWWLKEVITNSCLFNRTTVELVLVVIILVLITLAFL